MKNNHNLARTALTLLLALLTTALAWADEVTVGEAKTYTNNRPVQAQYKYSMTQQIYTPALLGGTPFTITAIGFENIEATTATRQLEIYMVETVKNYIINLSDWIPVCDADLVFSGKATFVGNGWNSITLDRPYTYDGSTNMALIVNDKTGDGVTSTCPQFRVHNGLSNYQSMYVMTNDAAYDAANMKPVYGQGRWQSVNQLKLQVDYITDAPAMPTSVTISDISRYGTTVTWEGEGTEWNLQYKPSTDAAWTTVNGLTAQSCGISGLDPSTTYQVRVQTVENGKVSFWKRASNFTTSSSITKPSRATCTAFTSTSASLSWMENGSATQWQICLDDDATNLINTDSNPYVVSGLTAGVKHTAKVRAVSGSDYSAWSNPTTVESTTGTVISSGTVYLNEEQRFVPTSYSKYSVTEQIYTSAELGSDPKMIQSIGFYVARAYDNGKRNLKIYMAHTNNTYFTSSTNWLSVTSEDLVFSGTVDFKPAGWINIPLTEPFEYDGRSNVAIIVDDNTGGTCSLYFNEYTVSTGYTAMYYSSDTNNYDPLTISASGFREHYKNQISLGMEDPVCRQPKNLQTTIIGPNSAELEWTEMGDATAWQLCVNDDETNLIDVDEKPYTLTGLTPETGYTVKVRAVKGEEHGKWSSSLTFTTTEVNPVPLYVKVSAQHTSATVSWIGFSESYNVRYKAADASDWQPVITVSEPTATIAGLTPATDYVCQVQGIVGEAVSEWSEVSLFTTPDASTKLFVTAGNWNEAANWMPAGVPTSEDDVVILTAAIIPDGVVATANHITIDGDDYGGGGPMARSATRAGLGGTRGASTAPVGSITIKEGGQLRHATDNLLVTLEKNISGYSSSMGGYRLFAVPFNDGCWAGDVAGMTSGSYDLYEFKSAEELEWRNYKEGSFWLFPNNESGYLYANSTDRTLAFTGRTDANDGNGFYSNVYVDKNVEVTPFTNGWRVFSNNAVSNAYIEYGTFSGDDYVAADAKFYKMNAAGNGFDLYKNYVVVAPGEAIFMEVGQSGSLHCSYDPLYRYEPVPEEGTFYLPALPLHGKSIHQDANPQILQGDVDGNGEVNADDRILMVKFIMKEEEPDEAAWKRADLNNDGFIDAVDVVILNKIIH